MITASPLAAHRVVSRADWLAERIALLAEEKDLTRRRDALAAKVRALPWVRVEKTYTFDTPSGKATLADLFGTRSQLLVYHFMFDPTWSQGCKSCSFIADHYNNIVPHLAHRDISFVTVSKAPIDKLTRFRERMGWSFIWVSGEKNDFGRDYGVSYTDQELTGGDAKYNYAIGAYPIRELPGLSVFVEDAKGDIFHTYSTYARGLEEFLTAYRYIDITPKGRDEAETGGMGWLRHRDRYGDANFVNPWEEKPGITAPLMPS
ncbi:MAG TPA: thioredoxin family protein [Phycisphaerales bacterium]